VSELREKSVSLNPLPAETLRAIAAASARSRRGRKRATVGTACGLLLVALCAAPFAPVAIGQGQAGAAGAAPTPAQSQSSTAATPSTTAAAKSSASAASQADAAPAQKSTEAAAQNEPQMQDVSAPPAESLGSAARRARTQKTKAATPKVYTDDSVTTLSGHGVSVVGDGKGGGGGSSYSGNSYAGASAQGSAASQEQYWRGRAAAIKNQMAACDQRISEIQDEIAKHGAVTVDPMSGAQAGVIFVEDRNAQIKQVERQKEGFQRQLEELEEEGRKAGADSGWFR